MSIESNEEFRPKIVAFCCNWCSYAGADLAGSSRLSYPADVKIIRVPCSCRVNPMFILRAFEKGADGVILCGCHPGDCHYTTGNYYARRRMTLLFSMLDFIGVENGRTRVEWVSAAEGVKFSQTMNEFVEKVRSLGKNVRLEDLKMQELIERAKELLGDGTVVRVLGWKAGDLPYNPEPAYFENEEDLKDFVYNGFCGANLSKYMIEASKKEGKTLVFLKPCDTYSFNQLLKEHRVDRDKAYIIGVGCKGKLDIEKIKAQGIKGIQKITGAEISDECEMLTVETLYGEKSVSYKDAMLGRCHTCKGKEHKIFDEEIGESKDTKDADRFAEIEKIEAMSPAEKFAFFQKELSKCIRCNACRNVCPACSCRKCVFDSDKFDSAQKANVDSFEEKMFHIIRAFHVAGRCTDCGECSRVCPQGIPLHLFNRKFIKDIDDFYGEYQAGEDAVSPMPLTSYTTEDVEPSIVGERG